MLDRLRAALSGGGGRPTKETMLIIFLSGILIFVILLPTGNGNSSYSNSRKNQENKSQGNKNQESSGISQDTQGVESGYGGNATTEYRKGLEEELEDFLASVAGVGRVKVLIYMKNSQEYVVEKDVPTSDTVNGENSERRREEATVYTVNDNGNEVPFIAQTRSPAIDGVVVAAEGAYDEAVRLQIVQLVRALYGVEANKVEVLVLDSR